MSLLTKDYPYGVYPFESFNPLQGSVLPFCFDDAALSNCVVSAKTGSGKTICSELLAGKALSRDKRRIAYLSPLKALAEEKLREWDDPKHPWRDYDKAVMTGDYELTPVRIQEIEDADIIISTYEMMSVRCRNSASERSKWLSEIGVLIVDEAHFLSSVNRGDHLENALILFSQLNPNARIVFLSATMTNAKEISEWLTELNGKPTALVVSDYRACPLAIEFVAYQQPVGRNTPYIQKEKAKVERAIELVEKYSEDQFLIFAHSKTTGKLMLEALSKKGIKAAFHNADLSRDKRQAVEAAFRERSLRILVATSTLAYGLNLPARRVIVLGVNRGTNQVDPLDVIQECGRAGRPKYDTEGTAYVIIEQHLIGTWKKWLTEGIPVESVLANQLCFHLIGEIVEGRISTNSQVEPWVKKTLAYKQKLVNNNYKSVIPFYEKEGLISKDDFGDISEVPFSATRLGVVASKNYFDPYDVIRWKQNISVVKGKNLWNSDAAIAWMIANTASNDAGYLPKEAKGPSNDLLSAIAPMGLKFSSDGSLFKATVIFDRISQESIGFQTYVDPTTSNDTSRILTCMEQIATRVLGWHNPDYWSKVWIRIMYKVGWQEAELCRLPGIGRVHANTLLDCGIRSIEEFYDKKLTAREILPEKVYEKCIAAEAKFRAV